LKRMVIFKKTNVGTTIVVIAKSECVVFNTVAMLDGKPQCVCQTEQDVAKLAIFLANDDLLINYAGRILFFKFLNLFKKKLKKMDTREIRSYKVKIKNSIRSKRTSLIFNF